MAVALLAAACAGSADEPGAPPKAATAERKAPAAPAPAPQAALPPAAKPAPPAMPPEKLIGMDQRAIGELLGPPQFRRADSPAQLWRYRAGRCILDLFLYPPRDMPRGPLAVSHVEARLADGAPAAAPACLDEVLKARASAGTT